ncbi:hypothetical protein JCM14202_1453 [Agrilactobacillus composti DSM 18527 = JCM 14202]|nr:hypothetical protein [Agrilactobacillus composti]GAF39586.1 hypothetical protein JCM14202_1453 [Agrilactobacillus composti DSM 18527 = JCM 14202]
MAKFDYRTIEAQEYSHADEPSVVILNERNYITFKSKGHFDLQDAQFMQQVASMYALADGIRQQAATSNKLAWFKDYVPYPLNSYWYEDGSYLLLIKQPNFTIPELLDNAKAALVSKFPAALLDDIHFERHAEGVEAQLINHGPVVPDNATFKTLAKFMADNQFQRHFTGHREVYLTPLTPDLAPAKLEVLIRIPIERNESSLDSGRFPVAEN